MPEIDDDLVADLAQALYLWDKAQSEQNTARLEAEVAKVAEQLGTTTFALRKELQDARFRGHNAQASATLAVAKFS